MFNVPVRQQYVKQHERRLTQSLVLSVRLYARMLILWILTLIQQDQDNLLPDYTTNTHTQALTITVTHTQLIWKLPDVHPFTVDVLVEVLQSNETQTLTLSLCVDISLKTSLCVFWELLICNAKL